MRLAMHDNDVPIENRRPRAEAALLCAEDRALLALGRSLQESGYRFTTVTPASHARIIARTRTGKLSLREVFGWSLPFNGSDLPAPLRDLMAEGGALETSGSQLRSRVRFSTLGQQLFIHSAFPTEKGDAVFFGPDTYRFARLVGHSLNAWKGSARALRLLDVGTGSGAGGLFAAALLTGGQTSVTLTDINRQALRFSRINAELNLLPGAAVVESDLFESVDGKFDLIISNPPYLVDRHARLYRHGGGDYGSELSLRIVEEGLPRLASGGRLLLYTGSAIIEGRDLFREAVRRRLASGNFLFTYEEIDPDVFGEELEHQPYDGADRLAAVALTVDRARS
jgi:release factor glutamine methyltransferase